MDRFFQWVKEHLAEISFIIAGLAALDAGFDMMIHTVVPPILTPIVTTFGGIAIQQLQARRKEAESDDDTANRDENSSHPNATDSNG